MIYNKSMMKKITILLANLILLSSLTACDFPGLNMSDKEPKNTVEIVEPESPVIVVVSDEPTQIPSEPTPEPVEEIVEEEIYDDENKIYSKVAASRDELVLTFTGDICFYDDYSNMSTLRAQENGIFDCILPEVMEGLTNSDICMVNNEFCYSDRGTPLPDKKYHLRSKPSNVTYLNDIGVDIVSLANNHVYDFGPDAVYDTFTTLKEAKVPYVGAGVNISEAMHPVYFKVNGKTIAYTSATQIERLGNPDTKEATEDSPGVLRTMDSTKMVKSITEAEANADFVIVYVHWGSENTDLVEESQKQLARDYVAAGADLIIGDHSHCLQGIDYVDGVPVFYSLGNFWFNSKTIDTGYVRAILNTEENKCEVKSLEFVPCVQQGCKTHIADERERERIMTYLQGISNYALVEQNGSVSYSDTNHNIQNGQNTSPQKKVETPDDGAQQNTTPDIPLPDVQALPEATADAPSE